MSKQGRWDSNPWPSDYRAQALKEFISLPGFSRTLNSVSQWKCFRVRNYATYLLKLFFCLFKLWLRNVCFQWCAGTSSHWSREPVWVSLQNSEFSHISGLALAVVEIFMPWKSAKATNQGFFFVPSSTELVYPRAENRLSFHLFCIPCYICPFQLLISIILKYESIIQNICYPSALYTTHRWDQYNFDVFTGPSAELEGLGMETSLQAHLLR